MRLLYQFRFLSGRQRFDALAPIQCSIVVLVVIVIVVVVIVVVVVVVVLVVVVVVIVFGFILNVTGGAIGQGMPCALGAAIACPDRPVLNLEADGSAMYTVQSLWSQAREGSNVTTLLCSNRSYRILRSEQTRASVEQPGAIARALTDLDAPDIGWAAIARGMGVPAVI